MFSKKIFKKAVALFTVFAVVFLNPITVLSPIQKVNATESAIQSAVFPGMRIAPGGTSEPVVDLTPQGDATTLNSVKVTFTTVGSFSTSDIQSVTLTREGGGAGEVPVETTPASFVNLGGGVYTYNLALTTPENIGPMFSVNVDAAAGATEGNAFKVSVENTNDIVLGTGPLGFSLPVASVSNEVTIGAYPSSISGTVFMPNGTTPVTSGSVLITDQNLPPVYDETLAVDPADGTYSKSLPNGTYNVDFYGVADFSNSVPLVITVTGESSTGNDVILAANTLKVTGTITAGNPVEDLADLSDIYAIKLVDNEPEMPPYYGTLLNSNAEFSVTVPEIGDYIVKGVLSSGGEYLLNFGGEGPPTVTITADHTTAAPLVTNGTAVPFTGPGEGGEGSCTKYCEFSSQFTASQYYAKKGSATEIILTAAEGQSFGATQGTGAVQLMNFGQYGAQTTGDFTVVSWSASAITLTVPSNIAVNNGQLIVVKDGGQQMWGDYFVAYGSNQGVFRGTVTGPDGITPVASAEIEVNSLDWSTNYRMQTQSDGTFVAGPVNVGQEYRIMARPPWGANENGYSQSQEIARSVSVEGANTIDSDQVTAGVQPIELTIGNIVGTIVQPDETTAVAEVGVNIHDNNWQTNVFGNSNENGIFRAGGLVDGTYKIDLNLPQGTAYSAPSNITITLATSGESQTITAATPEGILQEDGTLKIILQQPSIVGKVVIPDGTPEDDTDNIGSQWAWINVHSADWSFSAGTNTDSQGIFRLGSIPTGTYIFEVHPSPDSAYTSPQPRTISYTSGESLNYSDESASTTGVMFILSNPQVSGVVVDGDGSPLRDTGVGVHNANWSVSSWSGTNQAGEFSVGGLADGEYILEVNTPWNRADLVAPSPVNITITDGALVVPEPLADPYQEDGSLEIVMSGATKYIIGSVVKPDGADAGTAPDPVTNAQVNAWKSGSNGWANANVDPEDGTFAIPVTQGSWNVMVNPQWDVPKDQLDWVFGGQPSVVNVGSVDGNYPEAGVTFTVTRADILVSGTVYVGPSGTTAPPQNSAWVNLWNKGTFGTGTDIKADGTFSLKVPAGNYEIGFYSQSYSVPKNFSTNLKIQTGPYVVDGNSVIAGNQPIRLGAKNEYIGGTVTDSDGNPLSGIEVFSFKVDGQGWANATTNSNGVYSLAVDSGKWQVQPAQNPNSQYVYAQRPPEIDVEADETVTGIDFEMTVASANITGQLVDGNGTIISDIRDGFVWLNKRDGGFGGGAQIQNGSFTIQAVPGTYDIGAGFPPGAPYNAATQNSVVIASGDNTVNIVVEEATATVTGYIVKPDGPDAGTDPDPVTGIWGGIHATDHNGGWQWAPINSMDGSYEIPLVEGKDWYIDVWVDSKTSAEDNNNYVYSGGEVTLTNVQSGTTERNFLLTPTDSAISGTVTDENGDPVEYAWVYANNGGFGTKGNFETGSPTDWNGNYQLKVPAGTYNVGIGMPPEMQNLGYLPPNQARIEVSASNSPYDQDFQFALAEGEINGQVTLNSEGTRAFIWAWSEGGKNSYTETDSNGNYTLNVSDNDKWHIGASKEYTDESGDKFFYGSPEYQVEVGDDQTKVQNIALNPDPSPMSGGVSETFDAATMKIINLGDGTRIEIPAGAIASSGNITVTATPKAESIVDSTIRPLGLSYALGAFDSNGALIEDFVSNVTISFPYTEDQITAAGITEEDLTVAYWDTASSMWKAVDGFSKDTENNTITITTSHFSDWAPVQSAGVTDTVNPVVSTGGDTRGYKAIAKTLNATSSDLYGLAAYQWTKVSGPGSITFGSATSEDTTISASLPGTYVLRLTTTDNGGNSSSDDATVIIHKNGDVDNDGLIDNLDFATMAINWGDPSNEMADFDNDGEVNNSDFSILSINWSN